MDEKLVTFETNDKMVSYSSDLAFNDNKNAFAYGDGNIYYMFYQKYFSNQEYEMSTEKTNISICIKHEELKGDNITVQNKRHY